MKKALALLLALAMVFALTACDLGGTPSDSTLRRDDPPTNTDGSTPKNQESEETKNTTDTTKAQDPTLSSFDLASVMMGTATTDVVWGKQDEATKQMIIDEGKKDGVDISFGADGSMTLVDPANGETITQKPDGTWVIKSDDGTEGQYGGNWPENEFTKLLPKPDMTLLAASTNDQSFTVGFQNATIDQVKSYTEEVKAAGFTVDAQTEDQNVMGITIYSYTAKNSAGYLVTVSYAMGTSAVLLEKP